MSKRWVVVFLFWLYAGPAVRAQVATGNIRGTVSDVSGAVVPNCSVNVISTATGMKRTVITNDSGDFNAPSLPVGEYQVSAEISGFQRKTLTGIVLQVDQTVTLAISLDPGAVTQTVEVTAAAALLDAQTSSLGQVIENKRIVDLPLNGRNPFALGLLAGGTVPFKGLTTNLPIVAGGGRHSANDILLDGVDDNLRNYAGSVGRAGLAYTPSVDAVQEFKVKTNNFAAEYGSSAGFTMNATIKSGTNEFHGSAFEFLRNDKLDANSFVANFARQPKAKFRQKQFGATLGGPVRLPGYNGRNRTFFFVDYEGARIRQAAGSSLLDVPSASFRKGDFSSSPTPIYNPATRVLGPNGVASAQVFPGNIIPTSRLDPTVLKYQQLMPQANVGGPETLARNFFASSPQQTGRNQGDAKVDHRLSESNNLMARVSVSKQSQPNQGSFVWSPQEILFNTVNAVLSDTHVFSPRVVNEFRTGFNRANSSRLALFVREATQFTAQNGLASGPIIGLPTVSFNFSGLTQGVAQFSPFNAATTNYFFENSFQWADHLSVIRGAHSFKTGGEIRRFRFDRLQGFPPNGNYFFGATYTSNPSVTQSSGLPYADFLLGLPTSVINSSPKDWSRQRDLYGGIYIQDGWKLSRKLTLNLGLRYDLFTQPVDAKGTGGQFDPNGISSFGRRGIIRVPGKDGFSQAIVFGHHKNFAPRFGFAYQATSRFVIRGGWGMFFSQREQNDQTTDMALSLLNFRNITMPVASRETTITPLYRFTSPLVVDSSIDPEFSRYSATNPLGADGGSNNAADIAFSPFPMLQQYNLSLQYELMSGLLLETSYAGARGVHWVQRVDINTLRFEDVLAGKNRQLDRPFPFIASSVGLDTANVNNWYNSFNLRVERRFAQGLTALANYTISRNVDSGNAGISTFSNQGNTRPMDSYNLKLEKALSPTDIPQKFVLSGGYELPIGKGKPLAGSARGLTNKLIGGWQINGILLLRSGFPTDGLVSVLPPVFGTINRPDRVLGEPTVVANPGFDQYFNPRAFSVPSTTPDFRGAPVRKFGNSGRNVLRGPGSRNLDLSLFKDISLAEQKRLEFRAEAFNLSNTPTFDLPGARTAALTVGNASFGKLSGAQTVGRQVQFGVKLLW